MAYINMPSKHSHIIVPSENALVCSYSENIPSKGFFSFICARLQSTNNQLTPSRGGDQSFKKGIQEFIHWLWILSTGRVHYLLIWSEQTSLSGCLKDLKSKTFDQVIKQRSK